MSQISPPFLRSIDFRHPAGTSDQYPFNIGLLRSGNLTIEFQKAVTFFTGENGSGKSTILEAIAENSGFSAKGGNANHDEMATSDVSPLVEASTFSWALRTRRGFFMRAETLFNFASYLEELAEDSGAIAFAPYGGKSLHHQSHGEAFLSVLKTRLNQPGVLILDEPEAALSPERQMSLLAMIHAAASANRSQIIIATHSPILLSYPEAQIIEIEGNRVYSRAFRETKTFQLYARFLDAPERFHKELFQ